MTKSRKKSTDGETRDGADENRSTRAFAVVAGAMTFIAAAYFALET